MKYYLFILFLSISVLGCKKEPVAEIGDIYAGGMVVALYDSGQKGLVCSLTDIGPSGQNDAIDACYASNEGGYDDWFLPNEDQLDLMYKNLHKKGLGNFKDSIYWNSVYLESIVNGRGMQDFSNGDQNTIWGNSSAERLARPIRFF